jgi:glycosyltransferase involved in cell wall biosynthesis
LIIAGIPAYNEEKTIAKIILNAQKQVDRVIVCDDGSQDMTAEIAQKLGATVIRHEKNLGYGAAIKTLFEEAVALKADALITLDADGQHDALEIQALAQPLIEGKADVTLGSRFINGTKDIPRYRRYGIKLLTKMANGNGEKQNLTDAQCGFRGYNKRAIENLDLREQGMGISVEILRQARTQGMIIAEVPVGVYYHNLETSTHNPVSHGMSVLSTIIRLVVEERPLVYLGIPGVFVLIIGILFGMWTMQLYVIEHRIVTNVFLSSITFTLVGIFSLFTAITLFAIIRQRERLQAPSRRVD